MDDEAARRGAACVRTGRTFRLDTPDDPSLTRYMGRTAMAHRVEPIMGIAWDDIVELNTQGSTQWDGFGHFGSDAHGHYGGLSRDDHGVHYWAARSFATRGVLADVARWRENDGRPFDAAGGEMLPVDELLACLDAQGSVVHAGDVLLIRFGWLGWWRTGGSSTATSLIQPGLEPSLRTVEALWDLHVAAVGCDPALDPIPGKWATLSAMPTPEQLADPEFALSLSLHNLLPLLGMSIGEFFDLDALAADCAETGTWDCMLTSAPIQLRGGVATPANAVAIR